MSKKPASVYLILNPNSGQQHAIFQWINRLFGWSKVNKRLTASQIINEIKGIFESQGIKFHHSLTEYPGHATQLAKLAIETQVDTIIAMGGDGTINEVINGMVGSDRRLGVIPYGTANVFGLSFDLPTKFRAACEKIINGETKIIDLGSINGHYFACMAGVGFDAYIIKKADKRLKKIIGALSYIILAMVEYFWYRFQPILFKVDGNQKGQKGYFLFICNTKYYGGKFVISEKTSPTDGKLDICVIKQRHLLATLRCSIQLALGELKESKDVAIIQCEKVHIRAFGRHRIHCDAEYVGHTPATVQIHSGALKIFC
ncbi:MAG: diacylglycerol kinase family protein [Candidatus Margulisiibacteriota bacterium]